MTDTCRDCGASVLWCVTESGNRMPVDAKPIKKVMVLKINPQDRNGPPLAKFVDQYESHFAHCSAADARRKPKTKPAEQDSAEKEPTDA